MKTDVNHNLNQLLLDLESAITQAIRNPLTLSQGPLRHLESTCATLETKIINGSCRQMSREELAESARLVWRVRARSGRLRLLIDSAAKFYSSCFSTSQPEGLGYGVHGEWSVEERSSHLALDC